MTEKWHEVGVIGVDAGLCWLGDPCYIFHHDPPPAAIGQSWGDFVERLAFGNGGQQFNYDKGHPGLGVCVSTGWGDGLYPVEVCYSRDGRVKAVRVVFIAEEEDD